MAAQPSVLARAYRARLNMAQDARAVRPPSVCPAFARVLNVSDVRNPLRLAALTVLKVSVLYGTAHHSPVVARDTSI
jgi:hypothetical protein